MRTAWCWGQAQVDAKTSEISMFTALPGRIEINGAVQKRDVRQQPAQQPRVPSRPAADIQAGDGAVGQELADPAHRRLVGGAQRFVDDGHPLEMAAYSHVRGLPALSLPSVCLRGRPAISARSRQALPRRHAPGQG